MIAFGDVDRLQVGDVVLAIGNPFGVGQTVTSGIVSALGRNSLGINIFENFIQTDAAINPGNSGGALVDVNGNLLGINTAIYSRSGGSLGIGFAIPVATARQVMEGLIKDGQVTRGWIGVEPRDLTPEIAKTLDLSVTQGVLITGVRPGRAGQRGRPAAGRRRDPDRRHAGRQHAAAAQCRGGAQAARDGDDPGAARRQRPRRQGDGGAAAEGAAESSSSAERAARGRATRPQDAAFSSAGGWVCLMKIAPPRCPPRRAGTSGSPAPAARRRRAASAPRR